MEKRQILKRLTDVGVVPVLRGSSPELVIRAIEALIEGGIPVAEITMTVPGALKLIERCVSLFGENLTLGAGSVTDAATAIEAMEAGSLFVVTPTVKLDVIKTCRRRARLIIAGALTPSEILTVWEVGADAVKVFPAKAMGGPAYLRMIHEPLPQIPLVPTGGVTLETLEDYFKAGALFVGAGNDLVGKVAVEAGSAKTIAARAREYVSAIRTIRTGQ